MWWANPFSLYDFASSRFDRRLDDTTLLGQNKCPVFLKKYLLSGFATSLGTEFNVDNTDMYVKSCIEISRPRLEKISQLPHLRIGQGGDKAFFWFT